MSSQLVMAAPKETEQPNVDQVKGKKIFAKHCAGCHGPEGKGDGYLLLGPDPANLTPARVTTTTALQALTLSNNEFMLRQAEHLAKRVQAQSADHAAQCRLAFQFTLQRDPADDELQAARQLVAQQGLFALCRALLNANEFLYVD